ncbi:MAG: DUF58 domain-containing protein, partial [Steroidobacter sp.]
FAGRTVRSTLAAGMSFYQRIQNRIASWSKRRHGTDVEPFTITNRRIYILPTRLGLMYAAIVFAMALGGMNYGNNLALMLAFMLTAMGFVAMHHCHRNLAGLRVHSIANEPVFAGQLAHLQLAVENDSSQMRFAIMAEANEQAGAPIKVDAHNSAQLSLPQLTSKRGWLKVERLSLSTRYPFGLFRAWTVLHLDLGCLVYPKPSDQRSTPPPASVDIRTASNQRRGEDEYSSLREFHAGDSPHRIAWKAYARSEELLVKQYAGATATAYVLDWDKLAGLDIETRLSQLCRWIVDAHQQGIAYGIKMPGLQSNPQLGEVYRQQCLKTLALFGKLSG